MIEPETLLETPEVRARIMTLPPGGATPFHHHTDITDHMVCLYGRITIELCSPDASVSLDPGGHCMVARGRSHRVINAGSQDEARYLLLQGIGKYDFITESD